MTSIAIETRFNKLERSNRRLTAICFSFAVVLIVALAQGQAKPTAGDKSKVLDEVRTKKLLVVGDDGAELGSWDWKGIIHEYEESSLILGANHIRQSYKGKDVWRIGFPRVLPAGKHYGALSLHDGEGRARVKLLAVRESPSLRVFDEQGNIRAILGSLSLADAFKTIPMPESAITLYDPDGQTLWKAP